jgi:hypothetical protein
MIVGEAHFKIICKECDKIISQCRCPSQDKKVIYSVCVDCNYKKKEV